ncbi:MAG: hypothetical protein J6S85_04795 [Methanobrevibacter sp.]|nr:hypothetical protein [Methanobrevibacter sp.]
MELTRRGVCRDLKESPYTCEINYAENTIKFYFSSDFNKYRFNENILKLRDYYNQSLTHRFGVDIKFYELCDIKTYLTYEKRGFYLTINDEDYSCLENLILIGTKIIKSN